MTKKMKQSTVIGICGDGGMNVGCSDVGYSPNGADFEWQGFDDMVRSLRLRRCRPYECGILTTNILRFMGDEATVKAGKW